MSRAATTAGSGAAPTYSAAATTPVVPTAAQAIAAAAAALAATLPLSFNSYNLPSDVSDCHYHFINKNSIMTQNNMPSFLTPTHGCGKVLSYLAPPMG